MMRLPEFHLPGLLHDSVCAFFFVLKSDLKTKVTVISTDDITVTGNRKTFVVRFTIVD